METQEEKAMIHWTYWELFWYALNCITLGLLIGWVLWA